jgi:ribA/ribD-fused uncharacterized protein
MLFFFSPNGTKGYLSNFYSSKFIVDNIEYNCTEQFFMKFKQQMFDPNNKRLATLILNEVEPRQIKKYGRMVNNYNEKKWSEARYNVMCIALKHKFTQNKELKQKLLDTGNLFLVEASPFDKIWGIGLSEDVARKTYCDEWPGENLLGRALMDTREYLKKF